MSGHSKWSTIKHKKAKADAKKGKVFSKYAKELMVASREGGPDISMNSRLRLVVQKAKDANMPNDNINRAIEKGAGGGAEANLTEITYEAYGPNGVAFVIETLTDNINRTLPVIRAIIQKAGGSMANKGAVLYQFDTKGVLIFEPGSQEDSISEAAIDAGAEDIKLNEDGSIEVITEPELYENVRKAIENLDIPISEATITKIAQTPVVVNEEVGQKIEKVIEALEDDEDIQNVFTNMETLDE